MRTLALPVALLLAACAPGDVPDDGARALRPGALAVPAAPRVPRRMADIPRFPGMVASAPPEETTGGERIDLPEGGFEKPLSLRAQTYRTAAPPESVFAFYRAHLGGVPRDPARESAPLRLPVGGTSVVTYEALPFDLHDLGPKRAATRRATLARARAPRPDGTWMQEGSFSWSVGRAGGSVAQYDVEVEDHGLSEDWRGFTPDTRVTLKEYVFTHVSEP